MSTTQFPGGDRLVWNEQEANRLLKGENGEVARDLLKRGLRIESQAKRNASGRPGPNVDTGRLRASISHRLGSDSLGLFVDVGSNVPYAEPLETGLRNGARYPFLTPALSAGRD